MKSKIGLAMLALLLAGCAAQQPIIVPPPASQPVNDCNSCVVVEQQ